MNDEACELLSKIQNNQPLYSLANLKDLLEMLGSDKCVKWDSCASSLAARSLVYHFNEFTQNFHGSGYDPFVNPDHKPVECALSSKSFTLFHMRVMRDGSWAKGENSSDFHCCNPHTQEVCRYYPKSVIDRFIQFGYLEINESGDPICTDALRVTLHIMGYDESYTFED